MRKFIIFTDSACDMELETLESWGVKSQSLSLIFDGTAEALLNDNIDPVWFYGKMREGSTAKTSAINVEAFSAAFREELEKENDILYIGFSSGLSTTYQSACIAAEQLKEEYPEREILTVDSLAASAGFGMLVYLAVQKKAEGATLQETAAYVQEMVPHMSHWFTVDDLVYLKRGGRISPTVAFVGGLLGIRPVLHVDDEGHLINRFKVKGRKASIKALAEKYGEFALNKGQGPVYICHADCRQDADYLASILKEEYGVDVDVTVFTGPVIGAHSGPGTLALFFIGTEK
ncbi:MAG: DegV family protein [Clostridiales bacterium]|nr:DegV family protein [Clostridiales bacterium]